MLSSMKYQRTNKFSCCKIWGFHGSKYL